MATDSQLMSEIEQFRFDHNSPELTFEKRLAQENHWTIDHARNVIREYLRFMYLLASSNEPLTPSWDVDRAWHLHLSYSQSYWDQLCGDVIGRKIHHNPTRGGAKEFDKFRTWYTKTLHFYRDEFGIKPPEEIWPHVDARFAPEQLADAGSTSDYFNFPKTQFLATVAVVTGTLYALLASGSTSPLYSFGKGVLGVCCAVAVVMFINRVGGPGGGGAAGCGGGGCGGGC